MFGDEGISMWQSRSKDDNRTKPRGARRVNQNAVYFECDVCGYRFQEDPNQDFIECPQCGSDETRRV
jgi:rubrerythrin